MTPGPQTLEPFVAVAFLLFRDSHIICRLCTFSSSILGARAHRLNYDAHSFTPEIRMTNEDIL